MTAVRGEDEQPSPYLDVIDPLPVARTFTDVPRPLTLPGIVGELRREVAGEDPQLRGAAVTALARYTLRAGALEGFSLGYSVDANAAEAMLAGGDAWYSVVGGLFPDVCLRILAAVRAGDAAEARRLNGRLKPLWDLFTEFSSLRVMYAAVNLLGLCAAAPPRPILPLPEAAQRRVGQALAALDLA